MVTVKKNIGGVAVALGGGILLTIFLPANVLYVIVAAALIAGGFHMLKR